MPIIHELVVSVVSQLSEKPDGEVWLRNLDLKNANNQFNKTVPRAKSVISASLEEIELAHIRFQRDFTDWQSAKRFSKCIGLNHWIYSFN